MPGWGVGSLWTSDAVVLAHDFDFVEAALGASTHAVLHAHPPKGAVSPPNGTLAPKSPHVGQAFVPTSRNGRTMDSELTPDELAVRVTRFLRGGSPELSDVELDLSWATPLQRAVSDALRAVPRGEVVTYGELAALAGYPRAARAAGSFCAANRFAFFVPCHRVVSASGIGGYGSTGVAIKRRLLALEGLLL